MPSRWATSPATPCRSRPKTTSSSASAPSTEPATTARLPSPFPRPADAADRSNLRLRILSVHSIVYETGAFMSATPKELSAARESFLELVKDIRPDLHRYCSRLVGSAIDGEDVVQEALAKAFYAIGLSPDLPPLRPWLLRIAHNT